MMRLVFLFSAEERGLLLLGDPLYDEHYAVSTLVAKLQEAADQHGEEVLERRHDAWVRLLSTFRAVYGGVRHERLKLLGLRRQAVRPRPVPVPRRPQAGNVVARRCRPSPLPVDNRTVLHLLRSLQYLEMQGEARRLSFRALDIEQIGHVYEGLLDHTAKRAAEPVLGLIAAKGDEPEVALAELERLKAKGDDDLLKFLKEQTGRSENAPQEGAGESRRWSRREEAAGGVRQRRALFKRVRPFSGLVRNDTFDRPVVIRKGACIVTAGTDRRSSGTHYTPRSLTEPIVQYTLEPLVYVGPAEGTPKEEWKLRSAKELLDLKICDMACGSGRSSSRRAGIWRSGWSRRGRTPRSGTPACRRITPEGDSLDGSGERATDPQGHGRAAGLRPPDRGPALPVRRGQEPAGRRDGEALALAADAWPRTSRSRSSTTPSAAATRWSASAVIRS